MLTENDIVDILVKHLTKNNYNIIQSLDTNSKGVDIIADEAGSNDRLYIEVKGETSSRLHSRRFGKAFDGKQIRTHISSAVFAAMKIISSKPSGNKTNAAIAFPASEGHRQEFEKIRIAVKQLGIKVFWVDPKTVSED